jgi:hypothetical protein
MAVKRCPMCHCANGATAWQCRCGYEFGQDVGKTLVLLRDQRTNARIMLGLLGAIDLAAAGAVIYLSLSGSVLLPVLGFAALLGMTARLVRKLSITRASIRQLEKRELPRATLRKR